MGKFDKYRIDLKVLTEDSVSYEFLLDNAFFANIDGQEVQKGKVTVSLTVKRVSGAFEFFFQTEGIVLVPCDRCLDEMELQISSNDKLYVKFGPDYAEEKDNIIIIPEAEGDINVAWFIYEFVILAIPMKHIHAPGKCNKEMVGKLSRHLRTDSDDESDEVGVVEEDLGDVDESYTDPRWSELKKY